MKLTGTLLTMSAIIALPFGAVCLSTGCSESDHRAIADASQVTDSGCEAARDPICAVGWCGPYVDPATDASYNCGSCPSGEACNDNGRTGICGSECLPWGDTIACDYAFGINHPPMTEYSIRCNYINYNECAAIWNQPGATPTPADGLWFCCAADAGSMEPVE